MQWNYFAYLHMSGKVAVIRDLLYIIVSGILMVQHNLLTGIFEVLSSPLLFIFGSLSINLVICVSCIRSKAVIFCSLLSSI